MSEIAEQLLVEIRASLGNFQSSMESAAAVTQASSAEMVGAIDRVEQAVQGMAEMVTQAIGEETAAIESMAADMTASFNEVALSSERSSARVAESSGLVGEAAGKLGGIFAAYLGYETFKGLVHANIQFQQMYYTLEAATGSAQTAGDQMQWLAKVSNSLGINVKEAGQNFAMMESAAQGSGITTKQLQGLYLGLAKSFDIMHASTYRQQRVMYAFNEMISMGTIRTRQFQRMLQVDLPGVPWLHIAAKQLGLTNAEFEKLLHSGKLTAQEVIPALAAGLNKWSGSTNALQDAIHGTNATINRFKTAVWELMTNIGNGIMPVFAAFLDQITRVIHVLSPLQTKVKETTSNFTWVRTAVDTVTNAFIIMKAAIQTVMTVIIALIRSDIAIIVGGFSEIVNAAYFVVDGFELLLKAVHNFVSSTGSAFGNLGSAIHDYFTGDFYDAGKAIHKTGSDFKTAFSGGDLHSQFAKLTEDFNAFGKIGDATAYSLKTSWSVAGTMIADQWSSAFKKMESVLNSAEHGSAIPKTPDFTHSAYGSGGDKSLSDQQKSQVMAAMQTQLEAAKAGSMERLGIARAEVQEAGLLYGQESVEYQQALRRMNTAHAAYNKEAERLQKQEAAKAMKHYEDLFKQTQRNWMQLFSVVTNAVDQSVKGMIRGTTTAHQAMRNIFQSILGEFINMAIKMLAHWAATQLAMTSIASASEAQRVAIKQAADKQTLLSTALTAGKQILMKMWEVMAGVYAAIAGIPYVGPFLAPAMAIAAGALVASWAGRVASASGGWGQIPEDQMAMVHKDEMVLPAQLAEGIRGMIAAGGSNGGGGTHHYHIHAMDARSFRQFLKDNPGALAEGMKRAMRNGAIG